MAGIHKNIKHQNFPQLSSKHRMSAQLPVVTTALELEHQGEDKQSKRRCPGTQQLVAAPRLCSLRPQSALLRQRHLRGATGTQHSRS